MDYLPEPSSELLSRIMLRIQHEAHVQARRRMFLSIGLLISSIGVSIGAFTLLRADAATSGIGTFTSLLISDPDAALAFPSDFAFALLESLPAMSIAIFCGALALCIGAARFLVRTLGTSTHHQLISSL